MWMPVRIDIKEVDIAEKIHKACSKGLEMLSSEILTDCNEYCKERSGALIQSSLIHSDLKRGLLVWQTPYAARQYYEIRTALKGKNPKATWRWVGVARANKITEWNKKAQAITELYGK